MNNALNIKCAETAHVFGWNVDTLMEATQGSWVVRPNDNWLAFGFCIEEKFFKVGDVLFLKGNNKTALKKKIEIYHGRGASGFIVDCNLDNNDSILLPVLKVESVSSALQMMAIYQRKRIKAKVIAITGSVGKSTVREVLYHLINTKYKVYRTSENYNLLTGVALSIINTPHDSDFAVYEMAIGSPGSLSKCSRLAKPDAVVFTEIAQAHLKRHLSLENIVKEKACILDGISKSGSVVYYGESESAKMLEQELDKRKICKRVVYGEGNSVDVSLISSELRIGNQTIAYSSHNKKHSAIINLPGKHNAINTMAALAILPEFDVRVYECIHGLTRINTPKGRMEHVAINVQGGTAVLINDAFNANPASMKAAIQYLDVIKNESKSTRTILVCSDMLELGSLELSAHIELAKDINNSKIDLVAMTGSLSKLSFESLSQRTRAIYRNNISDLSKVVRNEIRPHDVVLVKGSHSTKIYELCEMLQSADLRSLKVEEPYYKESLTTSCCTILNPTGGAVFDVENKQYYSTLDIDRVIYPASLSKIFGLCYIYESINDNRDLLKSKVTLSKRAASVASKWVLDEGEKVTVKDLIYAAGICSSNEAMIALAEWHSGSESKFAFNVTRYARRLGLRRSIFRNATGLFNEGQVSTIRDILSVITRVKTHFKELSDVFATKEFHYRSTAYKNTNSLLGVQGINGFKTGRTPRSGFNLAITSKENDIERIVIVVGCRSSKERDSFSLELLNTDNNKFQQICSANRLKNITTKQFSITSESSPVSVSILGDTYFGEYYDKQRSSFGKTSYITKYGYQHSLKNMASFLAGNDLNIVNLESCLTQKETSPLNGIKGWVLGANPVKTIELLKAYRIEGVLLGNNHSFDYGVGEIGYGIEELSKS